LCLLLSSIRPRDAQVSFVLDININTIYVVSGIAGRTLGPLLTSTKTKLRIMEGKRRSRAFKFIQENPPPEKGFSFSFSLVWVF
jgi:hypothetical protein